MGVQAGPGCAQGRRIAPDRESTTVWSTSSPLQDPLGGWVRAVQRPRSAVDRKGLLLEHFPCAEKGSAFGEDDHIGLVAFRTERSRD